MTVVEVLLVLVRLAIGFWLLGAVRRLTRPGRPVDRRGVSVVVPARDEEASLPVLLRTLPGDLEVVVVDDGSTDGTGDAAARAGARVVAAGPLPDGWAGKPWACSRGAAQTEGEVLVFVDADVCFDDGGFDAVVAEVRRTGGLVSVQPFHEPGRPVERFAQLFNIVGFAGTDAGSPLGRWRGSRGAFGPVLATSRTDHDHVGGHASVRSSVIEDVALAQRYRDAGLPVTVLAGDGAVRFRMYPDGLGQLVEGFTKNLASGVAAIRRTTALLVLAWMTVLVQASIAPVRAVVGNRSAVAAAVLYLVVAAQVWSMGRPLGRFGVAVSLAFPVSTALFLVVFARSVVATATGSVSWRGRTVSTRRR